MRINKPKFWDQKISLFSLILLPFTILVKLIIVFKKRLIKGEKFNIPVICIGNIYLGGTGKTPTAILIASELVKIGKYNVVERTKIDEILKEQKLQMSGCVEECLIDVGKMLGAKQIILGSVGKLGSLFTITAKLVDATSGEMIQT